MARRLLVRSSSSLWILDRAAAPAGALAKCWLCRWWWTWSAERDGRQRRAGQALALQVVVVDVVSSARRAPAARPPGASAAGRGDRRLRFAALAGALASM
ncbi:hypothetical protein [Achromobacter xylosoxidans]|uniref:hypothetical protein n=1 Tax=Alcaligenes xylosoxydans xylosoxydans TaxID=85698 RepID=UPI003D2B5D15